MLMYRVDAGVTAPVPVECPEPCWPNRDADGEKIFENTHFRSIGDAWEKLEREMDAWVTYLDTEAKRVRKRLGKLESELVQTTQQAESVRAGRRNWLESVPARDAEARGGDGEPTGS